MSTSQILGLFGSLLLLVAPVREQFHRWFASSLPQGGDGDLSKMRGRLAVRYRARASEWKPLDSWSIILGAIFLAASYLVGPEIAVGEEQHEAADRQTQSVIDA